MVLIFFLSFFLAVFLIIAVFLNLAPQFGAEAKGQRLETMTKATNFINGRFTNLHPVKDKFTFSDFIKFFPHLLRGNQSSSPNYLIPVIIKTKEEMQGLSDTLTSVIWFGHSAVFIKIDGHTVFLDPMLGMVPAPLSFLGRPRFNETLPVKIEDLPFIDAVLLSHDHYDHLDHQSILKLKAKTGHFYVPLGVGAHLEKWGVAPDKISELCWWEETTFNGLTFISTPAQHFSGRSFGDKNKTLWTSWVIKGKEQKIFFSGDSGYFDVFKEIGDKHGPFDLTLFECGEYNKMWAALHSFPEETVQAHLDLRGKALLPVHWGAFALSKYHDWNDPVKRLSQIAKEKNIQLTTPLIGETVILEKNYPDSQWWLDKK